MFPPSPTSCSFFAHQRVLPPLSHGGDRGGLAVRGRGRPGPVVGGPHGALPRQGRQRGRHPARLLHPLGVSPRTSRTGCGGTAPVGKSNHSSWAFPWVWFFFWKHFSAAEAPKKKPFKRSNPCLRHSNPQLDLGLGCFARLPAARWPLRVLQQSPAP